MSELINASKEYYVIAIDPSQILSATDDEVLLELDKLRDLKSMEKKYPLIYDKINTLDLPKSMSEQLDAMVDYAGSLKWKLK